MTASRSRLVAIAWLITMVMYAVGRWATGRWSTVAVSWADLAWA